MARTYKRDGNGRFAGGGGSSGGGGGKRPAAKSVSRGVNRLTRDNAGKITSVGGEGATARGGRLKTAAGNKRAMQTAKVSGGRPVGTMKGKIKRDPGAAGKIGQSKAATKGLTVKRSAQAEADRGSAADRKERAKRLSAMPKEGRRAVQTAKTASRQRQAKGQLGVGIEGRRGRNTDQLIGAVNEGSTRLRFDAGKRKSDPTKLTEGQRAATARSMAGSANSLKARMRTTAVSKRTKAFGGTTAQRQLPGIKGTIKKQTKPPIAKPLTPKPANAKGARLGGTRKTTKAAAPKNTTPNKTGQSKTLNKFNSRPIGTMVAGKGINLVPSTKRVPLQVQQKVSDTAFARVATKAARTRAAAPAKAAARQTAANRPARALANQKRTTQAIAAKGGKRFSPTRKQKKSLAIADAARTFYSANRVNSLPTFKVDTSKPGYRKPKPRP